MNWKKITVGIIVCMAMAAQGATGKKLHIAVGDWPPYLSADLEHSGVIAHMITDILVVEGYQVKIHFLPWGRVYKEAALGTYNLTGVWMHKPEREADFYYSAPILTEQFVFFHLKTFSFDWKTLDDLQGINMGGGIEYSYGPEFDMALKSGKLKIERVSTDEQNFAKLLRKRIQVFPQEMNVGYSSLRKHFPTESVQKITHHPKHLLNNQSYVLFPKKLKQSKMLLSKFNKRLKQFKESGRYETYFKAFDQGEYQKE